MGHHDQTHRNNGIIIMANHLNRRTSIGYRMLGKATELNLFFVYTEFLNDLQFFDVDFNDTRLRRIGKLGVAFTSPEKFSILGISFGGAGVEVSVGDRYVGIGFTTGFPF